MKILACTLLCVCAVYADSGYADVSYGGYLDLKTPYKGLYINMLILTNQSSNATCFGLQLID